MKATNNRFGVVVVIGLASLVIGVGIGVAGTEFRSSKAVDGSATQMSPSLPAGPNTASSDEWNPFLEIQNKEAQMDQSFDQMFERFQMEPQFNLFEKKPGYSLSLGTRNLKNCYQVRAFLPDAEAADVHVSLGEGKTLKVEGNNKQAKVSNRQNGVSRVTEWGNYAQVIQLPAPVKAGQMKVKRKGHELIITLPKVS